MENVFERCEAVISDSLVIWLSDLTEPGGYII